MLLLRIFSHADGFSFLMRLLGRDGTGEFVAGFDRKVYENFSLNFCAKRRDTIFDFGRCI